MMIATGSRRKSWLEAALKRVATATIFILAGLAPVWPGDSRPALYWYDEDTGIAIGGFDPLAYVIYGEARRGRPDIEYTLEGLTWRFLNVGNRDAFAEAVSVYAPAFGGYDVVGVARGVLTRGNPVLWRMHKGQLLLFYSPAHRELFDADPANYLTKAGSNWHDLARKAPRWPGQYAPHG